ncbi:MAG: 4Fe-4S dicluster domain-containing protein [Bacteroidia bacterium]|nr:4Fe-4S dicluster domain-containing protein [Bacteroidia bacterium]
MEAEFKTETRSELYNLLTEDVRFIEGLKACINCGTCTAICPAAEFYNYHPRVIVDIIQSKNNEKIEELLKNDFIWYCGECMSCKTRCPRGNVPGLIVMALRALSQELGYFAESEKGRQQLAIKRTVGQWILDKGYCLYLEGVGTDLHPEQGPVWDWFQANYRDVMDRLGANYEGDGPGILRKIPRESLNELKKIFDATGATKRFKKIEKYSEAKAREMKLDFGSGMDNEYFRHIYSYNSNTHNSEQNP